jgi:hypothetical protein
MTRIWRYLTCINKNRVNSSSSIIMKIVRSNFVKSLMGFLCLCGVISAASAQQAPKPVFTLEFLDGPNAINAKGEKIPARVEGDFVLHDSPHGKAMLSGPSAGMLHFPAQGTVNAQSGTVEMWVQPLDWDGHDNQRHVFFDAGGQGVLYLYKHPQWALRMFSSPVAMSVDESIATALIYDWKPGKWHFIAGTWSPSKTAIYVDGKLINSIDKPTLPSVISGDFAIGDGAWGNTRSSQSLVAGVRIYDRALSAEHIAAHYTGDYSKVVPLSPEVPVVNMEHDAKANNLNIGLNVSGADMDESAAQVQFSLQQEGKIVKQSPAQKITNSTVSGNLNTSSLKAGTYQVVANISAGLQNTQITRDFVVPDLSWLGNKLGEEDVVLPPWTPMTVALRTGSVDVSCWGRTYQFRGAPLPTQIISQGNPMLAHPIELKVFSGSRQLQWQNGKVKVLKSSPTHVILQGSAEAKTNAGRVLLTTNIRLEYDGLATVSMNLQKPTAWQPDTVSFEMSLRPERALYYHRASDARVSPSGSVPKGTGVVDKTPFQLFSWLGDNERGLFWFCETAEFWPNWQDENALEIVRAADSVSIKANLVKGQNLPDNWTYDYGVQATPVKAIPADWRKARTNNVSSANKTIVWPWNYNRDFKYFGHPEVEDEAAFAAAVKRHRAQGQAVVPYSCLDFMSSGIPEYRWFEKQWYIGTRDNSSPDVISFGASFDGVSPKQKSLQDFLVWKNLQFMKKFDLDGYYQDQSRAFGSTIESAGYGWQDGEIRRHTYGLLANRELYRRIYAVTKKENPDSFLQAHMSAYMQIPFLAYDDAVLNGEQYEMVQDSYMDVMSLDQWRAIFTGKQWGVVGFFLPMFSGEHATEVAPTRGLAALVMLHDVSVRPMHSNIDVWETMYGALDKFGYVESSFIPYWSPQPPASTDMKDVYMSAYKRKDGRALVVVGNTSREPRSGTVTLNKQVLGLPAGQVFSWPDGKPLSDQKGKVQISMEGLDYRLLLVGKPPA